MARCLSFLAVLLIFPVTAFAQTLDKEKLRKAAYLPRMSIDLSLRAVGWDERGKKIDYAKAVEELTERLSGVPKDAETYLEIAMLQRASNQERAASDALMKAEQLLRAHVRIAPSTPNNSSATNPAVPNLKRP